MTLRIDGVVRFPRRPDTLRVVREPIPTDPRPPRLLDRVREANRLRHGRSTEKSHVGWIRRYIQHETDLTGGAGWVELHGP